MATRTAMINAPTATATTPTATTPKMRQYKDFLTPSMHRRFTDASLVMLGICYVEATFMSSSSLLWRFFPLGMTGVRTLLLFLPVLAVFVIRLSRHHIGERNTTSGFETLFQLAGSQSAWMSLGWYMFSAFFFGEVFIWSRGAKAHLGWVDEGRSYERSRLNENPILLRSLYGVLAVAQTAVHAYYDYDATTFSYMQNKRTQASESVDSPLAEVSISTIRDKLPVMVRWCFQLTITGIATINIVYFSFLRRTAWRVAYSIGSAVFTLPDNPTPTGVDHALALIWQAFSSSFLLFLLWETSNAVFTFYISKPPTKKGYPLTAAVKEASGAIIARSEDPNGSLISGLRSKKELSKSFALWELNLICTDFPVRRKSLFVEVDRQPSSTWLQVSGICLAELDALRTRIQIALAPVDSQAKLAEAELRRRQHEGLIAAQQQQSFGLPRIANQAVRQDAKVVVPPNEGSPFKASNIAKTLGQHPGAQSPLNPLAKAAAQKAVAWGYDRTLSKGQREQISPQGISKRVNDLLMRVLRSPFGLPFRQPFARLAEVAVFGVPYSKRVNIVHAVRSLTALALASLKDDDFGQVSRDIPIIVRTFTATINDVEGFLARLAPSWTDVEFDPGDRASRKVKGVDEVTDEMRRGLEQILLAFGEYATNLGLSRMELRLAKDAVGKGMGSEMVKVG